MISIGIDIGGTSVKAALADIGVRVIAREQMPTHAAEGPEAVIQVLNSVISSLLPHAGTSPVAGIGIGMAGTIDIESGIVYHPPNFRGWEAVPLGSLLSERWQLPVRVENDANCAALGEAYYGSARDISSFIGMTLGTGVGGGIIIDRKVYHGDRGFAGEIGHTSIDLHGEQCDCGNRGCIEAYVGVGYLMRRAIPLLQQDSGSLLHARAVDEPSTLSPKDIAGAALNGDVTAAGILGDAGTQLGCAVANAANLLDLTTFIIGGGVAAAGELIFAPLRESARSRVLKVHRERLSILPAALGNDAGMYGAASLLAGGTDG